MNRKLPINDVIKSRVWYALFVFYRSNYDYFQIIDLVPIEEFGFDCEKFWILNAKNHDFARLIKLKFLKTKSIFNIDLS